MAKATRKTITLEPITTITLELSVDEAIALKDLTRAVGGRSETTRRKLTDGIELALQRARVPHTDKIRGSVEFTDNDDDDDLPF